MAAISELYKACRSGDLSMVALLSPLLTVEEINQLEPNAQVN